jgi:hypothetical protein
MKKESTIPLFTMVGDLSGDEYLVKLLELEGADQILEKNGDYYVIKDIEVPFYLAFNKGIFIFTTDENSITAFRAGGYKENLSSSPLAKNLHNNMFYAYMTLNYEDYPPFVKDLVNEEREAKRAVQILDDFFSNMEINSTMYQGEFVVNTANEEGNSLTGLLLMIDKLVMMFN